jgi:hypothetical protein
MRWRRVAGAFVCVAIVVALEAGAVEAAGTVHGAWTIAGANPSWTGTLDIAANGFPDATVATNSNTPTTPTAAFLNAATPYGAVFGSTQGSSYLNAAAAAGQTPSTTTITFASQTPAAGWGFAFGDIDADQIQIAASGPGGTLTAAQLGFQGVFNYCTPTTPRPASCGGAAQTDVPTWVPATSTLVGNVADTNGASGWFRPTVPITSITLTYSVLSGIPSFQMWASAITSNISGAVTLDGTGDPAPAGTTLRLLDADGNEIATTATIADGTYAFINVPATAYRVEVVPPAGYQVVGAAQLDADATAGDVTDVDFVLALVPPPTTSTTTTSTSPPTTTTTTTTTTVPPTTTTTSTTSTLPTTVTSTSTTTSTSTSTTTATGGGSGSTTTTLRTTTTTRPTGQLPSTGNTGTGTIIAFAAMMAAGGIALALLAKRHPR